MLIPSPDMPHRKAVRLFLSLFSLLLLFYLYSTFLSLGLKYFLVSLQFALRDLDDSLLINILQGILPNRL